jgi:glycine cleavage system H protein
MKKNSSKDQNTTPDVMQKRCIWMTAGVISFKLCPINYDCEHCDFDQVMRSQVKSGGESSIVKMYKPKTPWLSERPPISDGDLKESPLFFTFSTDEVDDELYLHPTHLWIRRSRDHRWMLGIDKLLAYVLPPPLEVELYGSDVKVMQNQLLGKVHTQAGTVPITSPLSGRVVQANSKLAERPELMQQDPYQEGWLAEIEWFPCESELGKFFPGTRGKRFLEEEAQHLKFLLKHRGIKVNNIGETLPDGGIDIKYLHQVVPAKVCLRLAVELMMTEKQAW